MDKEQWMYDSIIYEEVDMNVENEEDGRFIESEV